MRYMNKKEIQSLSSDQLVEEFERAVTQATLATNFNPRSESRAGKYLDMVKEELKRKAERITRRD